MFNRTRTISAMTALAGGALLLTGCGGAAESFGSLPSAVPGNAKNAAVQQNETDPGIGTSNCSENDFVVTMTPDPDAAAPVFIMKIANRSDKTCTIGGGWPSVHGTDMTGEAIKELPTENVNTPNPPSQFTLKPGEGAYAGVGVEVGDKSDQNAYVVSGFRAALPNMQNEVDAHLPSDLHLELPAKSLHVSKLLSDPEQIR